ncbi:hypothetical protein S83_065823 [Arachis hypogaea]
MVSPSIGLSTCPGINVASYSQILTNPTLCLCLSGLFLNRHRKHTSKSFYTNQKTSHERIKKIKVVNEIGKTVSENLFRILIFISYIPRSRDLYKDYEELKKKKNLTLEHYTNYKVLVLETVVLALVDLQLNTKASFLNAIQKYKQHKFDDGLGFDIPTASYSES